MRVSFRIKFILMCILFVSSFSVEAQDTRKKPKILDYSILRVVVVGYNSGARFLVQDIDVATNLDRENFIKGKAYKIETVDKNEKVIEKRYFDGIEEAYYLPSDPSTELIKKKRMLLIFKKWKNVKKVKLYDGDKLVDTKEVVNEKQKRELKIKASQNDN